MIEEIRASNSAGETHEYLLDINEPNRALIEPY
jgi:hypothetical protein